MREQTLHNNTIPAQFPPGNLNRNVLAINPLRRNISHQIREQSRGRRVHVEVLRSSFAEVTVITSC